jgi:hypothetical protein
MTITLKAWLVKSSDIDYLELYTKDEIYLYLTDTLFYKIRLINCCFEATEHEVINDSFYLISIYTQTSECLSSLIRKLIN